MLFYQRKLDKILEKSKEQEPEEKEKLEKGDRLALFIAAFITFIPVLILFVGAIFLISFLFISFLR